MSYKVNPYLVGGNFKNTYSDWLKQPPVMI